MNTSNQALWNEIVSANEGDGYGMASVEFAERWANLMEEKLAGGAQLADIAMSTSHEADTDGITGFMYGMAVSFLARTWIHGEALRRWNNKDLGDEDAKGSLNPATNVLTDDGDLKPTRSSSVLNATQALDAALGND